MNIRRDREQKCKEFTELNGGSWYEWSKECGGSYAYINGIRTNYSHPEEVLTVMMKREDWRRFDLFLQQGGKSFSDKISLNDVANNIYLYIIEPDKLLNTAWQWSAEHKGVKR